MDNITLALIKAIAGNSGGGSTTPGKDGVGISKIEKTNTQGLVDTYTISYTNGTTTTFTVTNGQDGQDGIDGTNGSPGKDGQNGITPTIGENGNWYLGDEDTGKPSRGEKGDKGDTGSTGPAGADGAPGTNGQDGSPGEDGFSPTITENVDNNDTLYKLDITTKEGKIITPNLKGKNGNDGIPATISIGDVTTGNSGTNASVTNTGTASAAVFNFVIPAGEKGEKGEKGNDGANGKDGVAATISIGKVSAGEAGTDPIVHNSGTSNVAVFDFTIPKGEPGTTVYSELSDKPSINGVILEGAKTFGDYGIQSSTDDSLNTADKTIVGAINELLAKINTLTPAEGEALLTVPTGSSE